MLWWYLCLCGLNWERRVQTQTQTQIQTQTSRDIRFFYCRNKLLLFTGWSSILQIDGYTDLFNLFGVFVRHARFFISLFIHLYIYVCVCDVMLLLVFYISIFSSHCLFCFLHVWGAVWYGTLLFDCFTTTMLCNIWGLSFCLCSNRVFTWIKDRFKALNELTMANT